MHFACFQVDGIIELASERIVDGKNSGFGLKTYSCAKSVRRIVAVASESDALIFIISAIAKKEEIRIFFKQKTIFNCENRIGRSGNRFFIKSSECF